MKKIFLILIIFIVACSNNEAKYYQIINELKGVEHSSDNIPFTIDISVEPITNDELVYHIIIDEPIMNVKDLSVIAIHDVETKNIYPSIGILDDKIKMLSTTDSNKESVKGVALVGYLPKDDELSSINFKIMINYEDDENNKNNIYYIHNFTLSDTI